MNPLARIFISLPALALLASCGNNAETLYSKAKADFAAENYTAARVELASALEKKPGDRAMLALLVRAHLRLADPDGAQTALEMLERTGAKGPQVQILKADLALLNQQPEQALALIGGDQSTQGCRIRAEAELALGNQDAAVAAFEKGMAAGSDIRLATAYARFRLQNGDNDGAAKVIARMQSMAPQAYETMVAIGDLAAAQGRVDQAIAAYRKVIDAFPKRIPPMLALANQYDEKGNLDAASALVNQAAKLAPDNANVNALKIQLMSEKGEWEKIRVAMQARESSLDPASAQGLTYAEALLRTGHADQALILFNRAHLKIPNNPYVNMMLGQAQLASGDAVQAWATLKPLAASTLAGPQILLAAQKAAQMVGNPQAAVLADRLKPENLKPIMTLVQNGEKSLVAQNWAEAIKAYKALLGKAGPDPQVLKRLAFATDRSGQPAQAIAYADQALALKPDDPDLLFAAAQTRLDAGRETSKARDLLEQASQADPQNPDIAQALKQANAAVH